MIIPTILDITQYKANPLGKDIVKNPNMIGIIHNIILLVDACRSSIAGMVVIFCISHMDTPTRIGMMGESGSARFIHKNSLFIG